MKRARSLSPQVLQDEKRAMISSRNNGKDGINGHLHHVDGPQKTAADHRNKIDNGGGAGGGGGGNSAEDEGISSSEQDDCEDDVPPAVARKDDDVIVAMNGVGGGGSPYNKKSSYGLSSQGVGGGTVTTATVDGVLENFDKVINDASTESGGGVGGGVGGRRPSSASSGGCADDRVHHPRRLRYYSSSGRNDGGAAAAADDAVIVPTRIVPEPPRRSRSLFVNKNFEVNPFFEDEEDDEDEDESGADSECAYDDDDDDDHVGNKSKRGGPDETFHSVQKQIERFSALALRHGGGHAVDHGVQPRRRDEDEIKAELSQHGGARRRSIYDVFASVEKPTAAYACGARVTRSASTRNPVDPRTPAIPRFVNHCGVSKSVYLPGGRGDAVADGDPKAFVATRANGVGNNAGLYSGYKDSAAAPKCGGGGGFGAKSASSGSGSSKGGLKALHRVNLSVSTGKLTDFPSGLY